MGSTTACTVRAMKTTRAKFRVRLGAALRARREARQISQRRCAELAGLSPTYYSEIERGRRNVQIATLARVASALKVRLWEIAREADRVGRPH